LGFLRDSEVFQNGVPGAMSPIREAAVAGRFYPAEAEALRSVIRGYLEAAASRQASPGNSLAKGIIAPHAGYVYSGPVAASAYAVLPGLRDRVNRVVLLGPAHFVKLRGLAAPSVDEFETPLGRVTVDKEAVRLALTLTQVVIDDNAHAREHSLEVHLPFLQEVLGDFKLVPLAAGDVTAAEVAEVIELLWGGPETLFVVSSDLSHFHDHDTAARIDAETSRWIESLQFEELRADRCCGYKPIGGLLQAARARGLHVRTLDLRNSGDTAGSHSRVVGYGAYVVE
jgi:AmmeMemoRadiSam system protein B